MEYLFYTAPEKFRLSSGVVLPFECVWIRRKRISPKLFCGILESTG
jgi:hypothetical protein